MADPFAELSAALGDDYRVERELGAGGMATVYLADDVRHHRRVAIKVLRRDLAAALGADRFLREITVEGGVPRRVVRFDDPARPWHRFGFRVRAGRIFMTLGNRESDVE